MRASMSLLRDMRSIKKKEKEEGLRTRGGDIHWGKLENELKRKYLSCCIITSGTRRRKRSGSKKKKQ